MSTPAATYDLGTLHGGLRLPAEKTVSTSIEIQTIPIPDQLVIPIQQHVGEPAHPVVGIGEYVLKGQLIAETYGTLSAENREVIRSSIEDWSLTDEEKVWIAIYLVMTSPEYVLLRYYGRPRQATGHGINLTAPVFR